MTVWPFLPVWPFLLLASGVCGIWNWRAGLSFAIGIGLVRSIIYFELNNQVVWLMALYSCLAFVVLFLVDRTAGGFFALVSALMCVYLFGFIEHRTEMILSEIAIVAGMIASGIIGPTGGLYTPISSDRPVNNCDMVARPAATDHSGN